jgi:hypothetical protein
MSTLPIRVCSACAGDYEDPDRTAWTEDEMINEDSGMAESETSEELREGRPEPQTGAKRHEDKFPGR